MIFRFETVPTVLTSALRYGHRRASTGAACPNLPYRPHLFLTRTHGRTHTRARTRAVKTTNKVWKVSKVRTKPAVIGYQPSIPLAKVGTGWDISTIRQPSKWRC